MIQARSQTDNPGIRGLRAYLLQRTGFWQSLLEASLLSLVITTLTYVFVWMFPTPWGELLGYPLILLYGYAIWRPWRGTGGILRRAARITAWALLFGLISSIISWLGIVLGSKDTYLGISYDSTTTEPAVFIPVSIFLTAGLVLPLRGLMGLWAAGSTRLRWRLTFSSLLVGLLTTLLIPLSLGLIFGLLVFLANLPTQERVDDAARLTTQALTPAVERGFTPEQIQAELRALLDGTGRLPALEDETISEAVVYDAFASVQRMRLLEPDGTQIADSGLRESVPAAIVAESDSRSFGLLIAQLDGAECINGNPTNGPIPDTTVCPILDSTGTLQTILVVESAIEDSSQVGAALGFTIGAALIGVSFAFYIVPVIGAVILPVAVGTSFLLTRRTTRRMEQLAEAAGALATGDLGRRVQVDSNDEVGRLSADFNSMAERLEEREQAITAEKVRVEQLLEANRQLVASVSHELRTPLATLRGYLEALEQDHGDKLPQHDMRVIQKEVQRLMGLINDLFTLARAEAQQLPLSIEPVDALALSRLLVDTLAPLAHRDHEIELIATLPRDLPLVQADRMRLEQVLLNLLQNALRHTPPGGIVALEGSADAETVQLTVADTGVGIPPEELERVFERLYRGEKSRARETGGAGLGLALVRELVSAMGGTVDAESAPGRGSRFCITLQRTTGVSATAPALDSVKLT